MWRSTMVWRRTPVAWAASTNSRPLSVSVWPARDARHVEPGDQPDAHEEQDHRPAEDDEQQDQHEHVGDRHQHVDEPHHDAVDAPAEEARRRAVERADDDRDQGADEPHHEADLRALHGAREEVAAELVHPEPVAVGERGAAQLADLAQHGPVDLLVGPGRHEGAHDREKRDEDQHDRARPSRRGCGRSASGRPARASGRGPPRPRPGPPRPRRGARWGLSRRPSGGWGERPGSAAGRTRGGAASGHQ